MNKELATELIRKYNEGIASKEEIRLVENWFAKQSELQQQVPEDLNYREIKQQMWHSIVEQIAIPVRRPIWSFNVVAAAAAVILIALAAVLFYVNDKYAATPQIVKNDINPGKNKAILTLDDGRKISLTDAVNGQLAKETGVTISKTADGQLVYHALTTGTSAKGITKYNTIEAPRGGQWQVVLPDGSKVFLNALSSLKYPVNFSGKERKVELKGEAYFEITHDKKIPFRVVTNTQIVEVLGTHFNIMAYTGEKVAKTTLLSGSVKVSDIKESLILKPGEQAQVSAGDIRVIQNVDMEEVMAWKKGYFKFSENLESIMAKVSRWYDVEVSYEIVPDREFKYKGEISRNKKLSEILNMLEYTGNVHFKIDGRRIIVKK